MEIRKNLVHVPSVGLDCVSPSRTQQQFKEECDVNNILRNYVNTGVLTHTSAVAPEFGDFSQMPEDYGEALALIAKSKEQFDMLPSDVRERFDNQPVNLINFLQDEKNIEEAVKLGLVKAEAKASNVEDETSKEVGP